MTLPTLKLQRRTVLAAGLGLCANSALAACGSEDGMYGLIGKLIAKPGQRDALVRLLLGGTQSMPGCRAYIIAADPSDENAIWITEVWDTEADHNASLQLPEVQAAIREARPLIEGFGERFVTTPLGGVGLG